jgi:hypothetical protein
MEKILIFGGIQNNLKDPSRIKDSKESLVSSFLTNKTYLVTIQQVKGKMLNN